MLFRSIFKFSEDLKRHERSGRIFKFSEDLKRHERSEWNDVSLFSKSRDFVNIRATARLFSNSQRFCKYPNANEVILKLCEF